MDLEQRRAQRQRVIERQRRLAPWMTLIGAGLFGAAFVVSPSTGIWMASVGGTLLGGGAASWLASRKMPEAVDRARRNSPFNLLLPLAMTAAFWTRTTRLGPAFAAMAGAVLLAWVVRGPDDERERLIMMQGGAISAALMFGATFVLFAWPGEPPALTPGVTMAAVAMALGLGSFTAWLLNR